MATILSAPERPDKGVNKVTPMLFAAYPTPAALAAANREDVEDLIQSTGFFRNKTSAIIGMAQAVCERFGGEVPSRLDDLVTLPGVGRKTANVILGNAYRRPGDHRGHALRRLARRFGWTTETDPVKVETDIAAIFPKSADDAVASADLACPALLPCPRAGLRRLPGCPTLPVVRRRTDGSRRRRAIAARRSPSEARYRCRRRCT